MKIDLNIMNTQCPFCRREIYADNEDRTYIDGVLCHKSCHASALEEAQGKR